MSTSKQDAIQAKKTELKAKLEILRKELFLIEFYEVCERMFPATRYPW